MNQIFFCGWNGFGQIHNESMHIDHPIPLPICGRISAVTCGWSLLTVVKDDSVVLTGFLEGKRNARKDLLFPNNVPIKQVSSCTNFTLMCSENGTCWRHNADTGSLQQVGNFITTELLDIADPSEAGEEKVVKVCSSDHINLALSNLGRVFSIPTYISLPGMRVLDVACGNEHSILLTDHGLVFSWGSGSRGQLGHEELEAEENPRLVRALQGLGLGVTVTAICSGAWHCAALSSSGDLYTWGWDCAGQLGRATATSQAPGPGPGPVQCVPVPIDTPGDVSAVSCGARHTAVLLKDGSVWGCGWNAYGQLGVPSQECDQSACLRKIQLPLKHGKITDIVCGGWSTCVIAECN